MRPLPATGPQAQGEVVGHYPRRVGAVVCTKVGGESSTSSLHQNAPHRTSLHQPCANESLPSGIAVRSVLAQRSGPYLRRTSTVFDVKEHDLEHESSRPPRCNDAPGTMRWW